MCLVLTSHTLHLSSSYSNLLIQANFKNSTHSSCEESIPIHGELCPPIDTTTESGPAIVKSKPRFPMNMGRRTRSKFGTQLAFFGGVHQPFFRTGFETMKTLIDESRTLYAAIQARRPDGPAERFVISYTSEQALRDLLAAPSIIASGCTTRARAEELCRGETPARDWSHRRISAFVVSVPCRLARTLRVVFGRNGKLLFFLGRTWRMFSEKSFQVGRASA
jgi:hypothetical protein